MASGLHQAQLEGLSQPASILRDQQGIPHIYAGNREDAAFLLGYVHGEDRFFQMDSLRRQFSGRLAELLGPDLLPTDVQFRNFGLHRGAQETLESTSSDTRAWLEAYANGVNAFLATQPLPAEYQVLELTEAQVPAWTPLDSLTVGKGLAFSLAFNLSDIGRTVTLGAYQAAGQAGGFDGSTLLFEDVERFAPFEETPTIPGSRAFSSPPESLLPGQLPETERREALGVPSQVLELAEGYRDQLAALPALAWSLETKWEDRGSNWWVISGARSKSRRPLFAADSHSLITSPGTSYEAHLHARGDSPWSPPLNANGVTVPGAPAILQGCNGSLCWGGSFNAADVTDVFQEALVLDPATGLPTHSIFRGQAEPLIVIPQTFRFNIVGDGTLDNLAVAPIPPDQGGLTFLVPRRLNGPIVQVDASNPAQVVALSVQFSGWRVSREVECFRRILEARTLDDFEAAIQFFDTGSQNWAVADTRGGIAYWASGEIPLREDLQDLEAPDGPSPLFIRDGTGSLRHEWLPATVAPPEDQALPFSVLPFAELPQVRNPAEGFIFNANNDPLGSSFDNDPFNELRPGGGIFYIGSSFASLRAARLEDLFEEALAGGNRLDLEDMERFQADNQLLDAQRLVPFILNAFDAASRADAPASLAGLAAAPGVAEAVERLALWDFSTPTGIQQGYDPGDDPQALPEPTPDEVAHSVAATIYAVWRSRIVANTLDEGLRAVGLGGALPGGFSALTALHHHLQEFGEARGVGQSGVRLIPLAPDSPEPADGRDAALLLSLKEALDLLASPAFGPAFEESRDQNRYRWGYLHRIVLSNPLGGPFSIPTGGGFEDLAPGLPGIPRSGGLSTVDAAPHFVLPRRVNDLMFFTGADGRLVARLGPYGIRARSVIPGGQSAAPGSPFQADQLALWLTNRYHPMHLRLSEVLRDLFDYRIFLPAPGGQWRDPEIPMR